MPHQSVFRPELFKGQTTIVTGGGSGIGRCTAHELAALGANVAILGRTAEKLAQVKAEIEEDGGEILTQVCDIRDEAMVIAAIDAVLGAYGRIDGLVNNAGGQYRAPMKTISTKGFEAVVRSNLIGGFIFMREVYNRWMEANGGAIVNIIADIWHGWPEFAHSGAARGGMMTLTETAACEWSASGVRVNAVAPGGIVSSGFDTYTPEMQKKTARFYGWSAAAAFRHGSRNLGGNHVPIVASRGLYHGVMRAGRWWHAERPQHVEARAAQSKHSLRGLSSFQASRGFEEDAVNLSRAKGTRSWS